MAIGAGEAPTEGSGVLGRRFAAGASGNLSGGRVANFGDRSGEGQKRKLGADCAENFRADEEHFRGRRTGGYERERDGGGRKLNGTSGCRVIGRREALARAQGHLSVRAARLKIAQREGNTPTEGGNNANGAKRLPHRKEGNAETKKGEARRWFGEIRRKQFEKGTVRAETGRRRGKNGMRGRQKMKKVHFFAIFSWFFLQIQKIALSLHLLKRERYFLKI